MRRANPPPWELVGQTIRDANGDVVVSAINPCGMETRKMIVAAVNAAAERKPRRNCDVLDFEGSPIDMADQAWRMYHHRHPVSYLDTCDLLRCIGWLLAPAKEGGEEWTKFHDPTAGSAGNANTAEATDAPSTGKLGGQA